MQYKRKSIDPALLATLLTTALVGCNSASDSDSNSDYSKENKTHNGFYVESTRLYGLYGLVDTTYTYSIDTKNNEVTIIREEAPPTTEEPQSTMYRYNDAGYLLSAETYLENEKETLTETFEYGRDGRLLRLIREVTPTSPPSTYTVEYSYENGRPRSRKGTYSDIQRDTHAVYTYDSDGRLSVLAERKPDIFDESDPPAQENTTTTFTYSDNRIDRAVVNDSDGTVENSSILTLDEFGNLLNVETFNSSGELVLTEAYTYRPAPEPVFNETLFNLVYFIPRY